jgi:3-phosphoshikimate 1-carboxyvinyltransferase
MKLVIIPSSGLKGKVRIPASKSHTIRAVVIGTLADGVSKIINPLNSKDTLSAVSVCSQLGAKIDMNDNIWLVHGTAGKISTPDDVLDVGNSGTTLYITLSIAGLCPGYSVFTGDKQTRRRTAQPLIDALNTLGAEVFSTRGNGCTPIIVKGRIKGGKVKIDGSKTSQYISSLLISTPLAENNTEIQVINVTEKPYIQMTMNWMTQENIKYSFNSNMDYFYIEGNQGYKPFDKDIPGDFSSATFFLCAAAMVSNSEVILEGLDMNDVQGDRIVVDMLRDMGAKINVDNNTIKIQPYQLNGCEFDMSGIPDALPAMAVIGCMSKGTTRLVNVAQARLKETDRIKVMCEELSKMGANIEELPDGLIIHESKLHGTYLHGHGDHRVVMALSIAGLVAEGETIIDTAEAIQITFPNFVKLMRDIGADMKIVE